MINLYANNTGQIDLPAMIDYALAISGQPSLHYIGHSQVKFINTNKYTLLTNIIMILIREQLHSL
jgi:hypothetical protein